ncbi:hypothetical protein VTN00DRAFT_1799 [Thermoascus crustaceus]|uniref:uncharacterized protein n=1 Tax=Thermoascus crustaceus TaxID=5088 RepID=UPI00374331DC
MCLQPFSTVITASPYGLHPVCCFLSLSSHRPTCYHSFLKIPHGYLSSSTTRIFSSSIACYSTKRTFSIPSGILCIHSIHQKPQTTPFSAVFVVSWVIHHFDRIPVDISA